MRSAICLVQSFLQFSPLPITKFPPATLAIGHSNTGQLPHATTEAQMVAAKWQGQVLLEDEAQRDIVQEKIDSGRYFAFCDPR